MLSKKNGMLSVLLGVLFFVPVSVQADGIIDKILNSPACDDPCCDSCWSGWSIYADWLYWKARRCQLDYTGVLGSSLPPQFVIAPIGGKLIAVEPCYESGYRVGLMKKCQCLYFNVAYTRFNDCEKSSSPALQPGSAGLSPTQLPWDILNFSGPFIASWSSAEAKWRLDYDVVDILAGYSFNSCCCFETSVFGGLKLASLDQNFKITYNGERFIRPNPEDVVDTELVVDHEVNLDAYGIELGLGFDYTLFPCLNFFGTFSYDILLGEFKRKVNLNVMLTSDTAVVEDTFIDDLKETCWAPLTVANLAFGIGFNGDFCCSCIQGVFFSVGYEFHQWMNMLSFFKLVTRGARSTSLTSDFAPNFIHDDHHQTFGLDGLFVRGGINF